MFRHLLKSSPLRRSLASSQPHRLSSTFSGDGFLIEVDLAPSSSTENVSESEALMINKLDDVVQRVIVQKATPYWLPFLPGSSFWVPPRPGGGGPLKFADLVGNVFDKIPEDEPISFSASDFRWPSSRFYLSPDSETEEADESTEIEAGMEEETSSDPVVKHPSGDEES